jgi:lysophospholipase L1-like esterase
MKRTLFLTTILCLTGVVSVSWKALRYRKDAQLWHSRYTALRADPAGLARYRADNEQLRRQPRVTNRVVFLGASITEAFDFSRSFPNQPLVNRGVGGQLISQQRLRLEDDVLALSPATVVLKVCAINFLPGAPGQTETKRDFLAMVDALHQRGIRVVLATAVPVTRRYDREDGGGNAAEQIVQFNQWMRDRAHQSGDTVLDYEAVLADAQHYLPDALTDDGLHPNAEGQRRMMEVIRRVIIDGILHTP